MSSSIFVFYILLYINNLKHLIKNIMRSFYSLDETLKSAGQAILYNQRCQ